MGVVARERWATRDEITSSSRFASEGAVADGRPRRLHRRPLFPAPPHIMCSLEVFVPRSATGLPALHERLACLAKAEPAFLSISSVGAGALSLAAKAKELGMKAQLQLDTSMSRGAAEGFLKQAIAAGVSDVLLLPAPSPSSAAGGFASVLEMVEFVCGAFGKEQLTVAVCGYLRGTRGEHGHYSKDAEATSSQIKAGASLVITTPVWDVNHLVQYLTDVRVPMDANLNKLATIQPAVMPLHALPNRSEFDRLCRALGWTMPSALTTALDKSAAQGETGWRTLGTSTFKSVLSELKARCSKPGIGVPHVITMNAHASLEALLEAGFAIGPLPAAAPSTSSSNAAPPRAPPAATAAAAAASGGDNDGAAPPLIVPPGSTLHIVHSNKMALEVGELVKALLNKEQPQLVCSQGPHSARTAQCVHSALSMPRTAAVPLCVLQVCSLTSTEVFRQWAGKVQLMDPKAEDEQPIYSLFIIETVENEQPSEVSRGHGAHTRTHSAQCVSRGYGAHTHAQCPQLCMCTLGSTLNAHSDNRCSATACACVLFCCRRPACARASSIGARTSPTASSAFTTACSV